ncbi:O-antigen ligase family protein [Prosthecodimorpha staleyi]|uniref:O-antigen ligase family protein n=1 Tax=Prosthecodimorpha staleyi TaxID=2840188 RepID=A0A947D2N3_9HYPH|nr:O-antigen ligase family protein [Prosthecodimorpha staleyi]MBT9288476.1 O-antigen ligase family protein [Prosthecodimorpha staleyi]
MTRPVPASAGARCVAAAQAGPRPAAAPAVAAGQRLLEWLFFASVILAVMPFGAVHTVPLGLSALCTCLILVLSLGRPVSNPAVGRLLLDAALVAAVLVGLLVLQRIPAQSLLAVDPAGNRLSQDFGVVRPTISINSEATAWSLVPLVAPILSFVAALIVFGSDRAAFRLARFLRVFGLSVVVFGLAQFLLVPNTILIFEKWTYLGSLTATFVNRNSAATFLGLVALIWFGQFLGTTRKLDWGDLAERTCSFQWRGDDAVADTLRAACAAMLSLVALFLSASRGGLIATAIGFLVVFAVMGVRTQNRDVGPNWRSIVGYGSIVTGFILFGGLALQRLNEHGADDSRFCTYWSTLSAVGDNWLFGTGFGTFADIFPLYRDVACAGIEGVWDRAHNSYLEATLGLGVSFLAILLLVLWRLVSMFRRGVGWRHRQRHLVATGLGALVLVATHAGVDFSIQIHGVAMYAASILAMASVVALGRGESSCGTESKNKSDVPGK